MAKKQYRPTRGMSCAMIKIYKSDMHQLRLADINGNVLKALLDRRYVYINFKMARLSHSGWNHAKTGES